MRPARANNLPPSLVANLQNVLRGRTVAESSSSTAEPASRSASVAESKPIILVTNGEGINAPGLIPLIEALATCEQFEVHVCAPESDKSLSGHSVSVGETIVASSVEMNCASAFEISGTPVDCVSLALSGALFGFSKPTLVISGISKGSNYPHHLFYSGMISAAREASISGIPSISISLNWKKDESQEIDFKSAADCCLPLIIALIRDIEKGVIPDDCFLNIDVPSSPKAFKGFKVNHTALCKPSLSWQAVSGYKPPGGQFMSKHQSLGIQLAQLGRDASAAGAARRLNAQRATVEVESVSASGKLDSQHGKIKKHFKLESQEKDHVERNKDLENGFVTVTPIYMTPHVEKDSSVTSLSHWLATAVSNHI